MLRKLVVLGIVFLLLLTPLTATAQERGSGRPIEIGLKGKVEFLGSLNPLRHGNGSSTAWEMMPLMYPVLVGTSPFTQDFGKVGEEGVFNALATDWTISEDGRVYTFSLRQDVVWSDGTPITATDVKFSFDALASGVIDSAFAPGIIYDPTINPLGAQSIQIVDEFTIQMELHEANCLGLGHANIPVVPAHVFEYDGTPDFDFSVMVDHPFDSAPSVVYGPFGFDELRPGEGLFLKPVDTWTEDVVIPAGVVFRDVAGGTPGELERFLAGELDVFNVGAHVTMGEIDSEYVLEVLTAPNIQLANLPGTRWDFIGLNLADPTNPQPGLDDNGDLIDQGHHPIFGDRRIRRALQHALDVPTIIEDTTFGIGTLMASMFVPVPWAGSSDLKPVPYDPALAANMLDEAGWPVGPDGIRICQGCLYALDGTPFMFELLFNEENPRRQATAAIVQSQLAGLGIEVNIRPIAFWDLLAEIDAQTFDTYMLGYRAIFPYTPTDISFFSLVNDVPGGFNFGSYYEPEVEQLAPKPPTLPGCDPVELASIYQEVARIVQDDQPYLWLFILNTIYAAQDYVQGFDPYPNLPLWNIHRWYIAP